MANTKAPVTPHYDEDLYPQNGGKSLRDHGKVWRRHPVLVGLGGALGAVLAVYLVGRGIAEFWVVHYNDPASYRDDWGGPSLAGVFAVHTGPAVAIVAGTVIYLRRRLTRR
jgi:hypothetical protein